MDIQGNHVLDIKSTGEVTNWDRFISSGCNRDLFWKREYKCCKYLCSNSVLVVSGGTVSASWCKSNGVCV